MELPSDHEPVVDDPSLEEESSILSSREERVSAVLRVVDGFLEDEEGEERLVGDVVQSEEHEGAERILVVVRGVGEPRGLVSQLSDFQHLVSDGVEDPLASSGWCGVDAILVDATFEGEWAAACCRALRQNDRMAESPLVVALSSETQAVMEACLDAGADDVVMTPCRTAELKTRLQNMIRLHRSVEALGKKNHILNEALSDLCESEAMLVQAEKLSVLGEMSAGIVHEINNPLNYSKTALFVLRRLAEDLDRKHREEFKEVIADISEGMDRVSHIVRDLRAFASRGTPETVDVSLVSLVRTAGRLLGDRLGTIGYREDVPEELRIRGNENQLCQVFLNILKNGVEATEMAGRSLEEAEVRVWAEASGPWAEIHFRDNGCGVAPGDQERIFEPFFSRKSKGKGMGLGLSICSRILDEHRARISVSSEVGSHTQFTIRFPREDHFNDESWEVRGG